MKKFLSPLAAVVACVTLPHLAAAETVIPISTLLLKRMRKKQV